MKRLDALLKEGICILETSGISEARLDAWLLLEFVLKKNRAWFLAHGDEIAEKETEEAYMELLEQRAKRIPLQHLTGEAWFMGYSFKVNDQVLIPRSDTEVLVEEVLNLIKEKKEPLILDMCTGSGCILLSLLAERKDAAGMGADVSESALKVAMENRERLSVGERAVFCQSDLFSNEIFEKKEDENSLKYDILVSNPPYIPTGVIEELEDEVKLHDPFLALDGKEDGLYFYRILAEKSGDYLKPGAYLALEIGYDQGAAVSKLLCSAGFENVIVKKDLSGLDRVVTGRWPCYRAKSI